MRINFSSLSAILHPDLFSVKQIINDCQITSSKNINPKVCFFLKITNFWPFTGHTHRLKEMSSIGGESNYIAANSEPTKVRPLKKGDLKMFTAGGSTLIQTLSDILFPICHVGCLQTKWLGVPDLPGRPIMSLLFTSVIYGNTSVCSSMRVGGGAAAAQRQAKVVEPFLFKRTSLVPAQSTHRPGSHTGYLSPAPKSDSGSASYWCLLVHNGQWPRQRSFNTLFILPIYFRSEHRDSIRLVEKILFHI